MRIYTILQCWRFLRQAQNNLGVQPLPDDAICVCECEWNCELKTRSVKTTWTRHITSFYSHRIHNAFESFRAKNSTQLAPTLCHILAHSSDHLWFFDMNLFVVCSARLCFGVFVRSVLHSLTARMWYVWGSRNHKVGAWGSWKSKNNTERVSVLSGLAQELWKMMEARWTHSTNIHPSSEQKT